jgi:hypothetical protein
MPELPFYSLNSMRRAGQALQQMKNHLFFAIVCQKEYEFHTFDPNHLNQKN